MSKQKETITYIFWSLPPLVSLFLKQQSLHMFQPPKKKHQPTTPQTPGRRGLHRGGRETEPGGLGGSACAALEGMT